VGATSAGGLRSGEVHGTPTLFINGLVHRGDYDAATLIEAIKSGRVLRESSESGDDCSPDRHGISSHDQ
jgi:hypothetical protein